MPLLIEAFAAARDQIDEPITLRLIGRLDARYPEAQQRVKALGLSDAVAVSEYVSDEELLQAYQRARVLVLPSDYEGFGLPVLEAMACGTPAICANSSSLPEVAGDVGIFFDSGNKDQLVAALVRVLQGDFPSADSLTQQAAKFTWQRAAEQTLEIYQS